MKNIITGVEQISPDIARRYLTHNVANRPLNKRSVNYLSDQMKRGLWRLNGEAICFSDKGNLMDGQHRLQAVIESGSTIEILVVRGVSEDSFTTYDTGRKRTAGDVFSLADIPNANTTSAIVSRFLLLKTEKQTAHRAGMSTYKICNQDIINEYNKAPNAFCEIVKCTKSYYSKARLFSCSELGSFIAYLTLSMGYLLCDVQEFLDDLYTGSNNTGCSTIVLLRERLFRDRLTSNKMTAQYKQMLFIKTWNHYRSGKNTKLLKWDKGTEGLLQFI